MRDVKFADRVKVYGYVCAENSGGHKHFLCANGDVGYVDCIAKDDSFPFRLLIEISGVNVIIWPHHKQCRVLVKKVKCKGCGGKGFISIDRYPTSTSIGAGTANYSKRNLRCQTCSGTGKVKA